MTMLFLWTTTSSSNYHNRVTCALLRQVQGLQLQHRRRFHCSGTAFASGGCLYGTNTAIQFTTQENRWQHQHRQQRRKRRSPFVDFHRPDRQSIHTSHHVLLLASAGKSSQDDYNNNNHTRPPSFSSANARPKTTTSTSTITYESDLVTVKKQLEEAKSLWTRNVASTSPRPYLQQAIVDLEREQSDPSFWDDSNTARANQVNAQFSTYTRLLNRLNQWQQWYDDAQTAWEMLTTSYSDSNTTDGTNANNAAALSTDEQTMLLEECQQATKQLLEDSKRFELDLLLSGPYDQAPARLVLTAGAGGTEANDWVSDLKRMYERHCEEMGCFTCTIEDSQPGDVVGYKSVDMLITGPNAYGWFQGEKGSHRLVRLSPFNANNKRQTTFAGVDVAPADIFDDNNMLDPKNLDIPDNELEITTMRSGGSGGQNVNKVNSAVRIKHLPSGLQVKCTQERSQVLNKSIALRRLKVQLLAIAQEQRVQEIQQIRGDMVEASWGMQIRNYVLHPYKMVKDPRTGWETSNAQSFLDGGELLEECMGTYLRYKAQQNKQTRTTTTKGNWNNKPESQQE